MPAAEFMRSIGRPIEVLPPGETFKRARGKNSDPPAVVAELRANGFSVDTVADLFNKRLQYKLAVPILLKWLPREDAVDLKESIVRALSVKWARPAAAAPLIKEFRESTDTSWAGLRWAVGNGLSVVADDSVFDDVVELLKAKEYGRAREMLPLALANMKNAAAVDILIESLSDEDLAPRAIQALGRLRAKKARRALEPFTQRSEPWIRTEARKALARIH